MATILEFKITPRLFADRLGKPGGPADILFFPGIRYERQTDAAPESTDRIASGALRGRDTLEIEN